MKIVVVRSNSTVGALVLNNAGSHSVQEANDKGCQKYC